MVLGSALKALATIIHIILKYLTSATNLFFYHFLPSSDPEGKGLSFRLLEVKGQGSEFGFSLKGRSACVFFLLFLFPGTSVREHHQNRPGQAAAGHPLHRHCGARLRGGRRAQSDRRGEDQ